jgi:hypothetical protein
LSRYLVIEEEKMSRRLMRKHLENSAELWLSLKEMIAIKKI